MNIICIHVYVDVALLLVVQLKSNFNIPNIMMCDAVVSLNIYNIHNEILF